MKAITIVLLMATAVFVSIGIAVIIGELLKGVT